MPSLSDQVKRLVRLTHPTPPKSIKVLVVPADGTPPNLKTLHTVETKIAAFNPPPAVLSNSHHVNAFITARLAHMVYHYEESACQPDIHFLPDIKSHGNWDDEAWNRRCVTGTAKLHLLFTRSKSGLPPNPHVGNRVSGDIFVLQVSDENKVDELLKNFYVDLKIRDLGPKEVPDLLQIVSLQSTFSSDTTAST